MRLAQILMPALAGIMLLAGSAQADDRFDRYFSSVNRCGVIGYCNVTAADILRRGPTGGRSEPFTYLRRKDACEYGRSYGASCRVQYAPRGAIPQIYVDFEPGDIRVRQPARRAAVRLPNTHASWCAKRYRSYRITDNSFQPSKGPRKACNSPYD